MPTMNQKNFGLSGVATTDMGLGDAVKSQLEDEVKKRQKKQMGIQTQDPLNSSGMMMMLGQGAGNG